MQVQATQSAEQPSEPPALARPPLYDRLGRVYNIATVVGDLIDRVMTDPWLDARPRVDEAHDRVSSAGSRSASI